MSEHYSWAEIRPQQENTAAELPLMEVDEPPLTPFYHAWWYLQEHPIFRDKQGNSRFDRCLDVFVARVNPETREVDDNRALNTYVEIWLECGPWYEEFTESEMTFPASGSHDYNLDVGGDTYEEAILALAAKVREHYGNEPSKGTKT